VKPHPTALVVDDERPIRRLLRMVLEPQSYKVCEAENGDNGLKEAAAQRPDVIILDLCLPDMDGLIVLARLRESSQTPVLVLSVRDGEADKIAALDGGANDYMTKPFGTSELLARLRVLQRPVSGEPDQPVVVEGDLTVDVAAHVVTYKGQTLELTRTEEALLHLLARNAGKLVTCEHMVRSVWGAQQGDPLHNLRVYIASLRKKLENGAGEGLIKTEGGIGYRLLLNGGPNYGRVA
jgi:two-component system, OmpR family, KDP operon response regulator KdpE